MFLERICRICDVKRGISKNIDQSGEKYTLEFF